MVPLTESGVKSKEKDELKHSYAEKLQAPPNPNTRLNNHHQAGTEVKVRYSTHNGVPAVIFKANNYYGVMAEECKHTLVGKFLRSRPQIEKIRSKFAEKITIRGKGKALASSSSKGKGKEKAAPPHANTKKAIIFCVLNMQEYYVICQGRSITVEKRFDLAG
ncbi:hypothetical protein HAX54_015881 [Datura stramonium]|uniref:Uncharacterized protein n=1 Tax=Datura stramonium TaxID=4076 RepID=A0ABS8UI44_DATST|nr:hypothetical protein [Datura stramonium]